ncbi:MAG: helix-hairpin-helix domain-containing protein [Terriglobia bacterium]
MPVWSQTLPEGKGKDVVEATCSACHGLTNVTSGRNSKEVWKFIVADMVSRGALLEDAEITLVVEYLAEHFGPAKPSGSSSTGKINVNKAAARELVASLGLTEKEAEAVVEYRRQNGNFSKWEDLQKVSELDSKKIEAKKDQLEF